MFFGEYEKFEEIGRGATSFVYRARREGVDYAVKSCSRLDTDSLKRFDREIRIAQRINHPNIIHILDYDLKARNPYYVMELCDGSLKLCLQNIAFNEQLAIAIQICEGIKALHDNEILHRDIKPANVLLKDGVVKISDFSLGFFLDHDSSSLTSSSQLLGTQGYIAPEIYEEGSKKAASKSSDIYSLGCTLAYLFSGGIDPQFYKPQDLPPQVVYIVEKCRANDPEQRYESVYKLVCDLKALQNPVQFLSISDVLKQSASLTNTETVEIIIRLLLEHKRLDELVQDLKRLKTRRIKEIIQSNPAVGQELLLLLEKISKEDMDSCLQFEDIDVISDCCTLIFDHSSDTIMKQRVIDLALNYAVNYNRYSAMRDIMDKMLAKLSDEDLKDLAVFLQAKRESLSSIEDNLGAKLPLRVRKITGLG